MEELCLHYTMSSRRDASIIKHRDNFTCVNVFEGGSSHNVEHRCVIIRKLLDPISNSKKRKISHMENLVEDTGLIFNKGYETITLPVVLYGYEALSLILREEQRRRVFQNRVMRKIYLERREMK
jgi:hypothetical protein